MIDEPFIKMHDNEVHTDENLVRKLLAAQFPRWKELPIRYVPSSGTDNALYRLGKDMVVRLPRIDWAIEQVAKEHKWLPKFASLLPLFIPIPLEMGKPGGGYPWNWSIYRWIEGENRTRENLADPKQTALDLADLLLTLQSVDTTGAPLAAEQKLRGEPLVTRDEATRKAIWALHEKMDAKAITRVWEDSLHASEWSQAPVWFHGDMLPGNLLFRDEKLSAVIDFGCLGIGDPACDYMIAWNLFTPESREIFRSASGMDDATWTRGRGHALSQALIFIPYYMNTNPAGVKNAWNTINEIIANFSENE